MIQFSDRKYVKARSRTGTDHAYLLCPLHSQLYQMSSSNLEVLPRQIEGFIIEVCKIIVKWIALLWAQQLQSSNVTTGV